MISNIHKLREALLHSNFDFLSIWFVSFMCVFDFSMTSGRNFPLQRDNWQPSQVKWMQLAHTQGQHGLSPLLEKPATTPLHLCISYSINLPFLAWLFRFVFQTMPSCQSYWFECATYVCHVNAFERPLTPTFGRPLFAPSSRCPSLLSACCNQWVFLGKRFSSALLSFRLFTRFDPSFHFFFYRLSSHSIPRFPGFSTLSSALFVPTHTCDCI